MTGLSAISSRGMATTAAGGGSEEPAARPTTVADALRDAIVDGEFAPNQRLVEADLSERFGASRGSIRTALLELGAEGLVERVQNRGARVRAVSLAEAIEITEVRMVLEGLCAAKAATRLTEDDRDRLRGIGTAMQEAVRSGDLLGYSELNRQLHALIRSWVASPPRRPSSNACAGRTCATSSGWPCTPGGPRSPSPSTSRSSRRCARARPRPRRRPSDGTCTA